MDLGSFIQRVEGLSLISVMVTQRGEVLTKHYWDEDCRRNVYSASKSFTSAAVGIAQREGLLSIDEKLTDAFCEDLPAKVSDHLAEATVRDLLTMQLGQEKPLLMGANRPFYEEDDWIKMSLAAPFSDKPGTKFLYNNVGPYLAGILVQRRAGCDLVSYLMPRLFKPLGIKRPMWEQDPLGNTFGAGGLFLNLPELNKLGLLYLQKGEWNGKQLIPLEWVEESTRKQAENDAFGYGYLFWLGERGSFRADGKYCQWSVVIPDKEAVISIMAECRDSESLNRAVFDEIYPQL
jgi:CubicO group peptidase (beta-lactamase class C family)